MERKIFSKLNLYDQIGYLMVGGLALVIASWDLVLLGFRAPALDLENFIIWFILSYTLGHFIQGITNIFIKEKKDDFNNKQKDILEEAKKYFDIEGNNRDIWNLCYMLATAKDVTGQVRQFNAYYSLYRGWMTIFFFESLLLSFNLVNQSSAVLLIALASSILTTFIFYWRSLRFWIYLKNKTLQTFLLVRKLNL